MKKDFKKISQADRLIGQINRYIEQYDEIFIVTIGETNPNTLDHLKYYIDKMDDSTPFGFNQKSKVTVIDKGNFKRSKKDENDQGLFPNSGLFGNIKPLFKF